MTGIEKLGSQLVALALGMLLAGCQEASSTVRPALPEGGGHAQESTPRRHIGAPPLPVREHTVEAGRQRAIREGRPLVIVFQKPGCYTCDLFNRQHLHDPELRAALSECVTVIKHYEADEAERFQITGTPMFLWYTHQGGELRFAEVARGLREESLLVKKTHDVLEGRNRCAQVIEAAAAGDPDARFVLERSYLPFLDAAERRRAGL